MPRDTGKRRIEQRGNESSSSTGYDAMRGQTKLRDLVKAKTKLDERIPAIQQKDARLLGYEQTMSECVTGYFTQFFQDNVDDRDLIEQHDSTRSRYNALVDQRNADVAKLRPEVERYNESLLQFNKSDQEGHSGEIDLDATFPVFTRKLTFNQEWEKYNREQGVNLGEEEEGSAP